MACIDTQLFLDFFNSRKPPHPSFMDFLEYIYAQDSGMVEKKDDKIIVVCTEIDIKEKKVDFDIVCKGVIFKEKVNFYDCIFRGKVSFKNCTFEKQATFSNSIFENKVYFDNSIFKDYVDFHESNFMNITSFYGVKFQKVPNFSACYFKEQKAVNLVNVDINSLDFKKVENFIEENYKDKTYDKDIEQNSNKRNEIEQKHKLRYAQNIKDSFRVIKDILIEQNNTLEAQEWHKFELYAKENELEIISVGKIIRVIHIDKNIDKTKKIEKIKLNKKKLKIVAIKIKNILPAFLKLLCGCIKLFLHFTFCLPFSIIKFMICSIIKMCFNIFYILFILFCSDSFSIVASRFIKYKTMKIYSLGKDMQDYTAWINCVLLQLYRNTSDHHTNFIKIFNFTVGTIALYGVTSYLFYFCLDFLINNSIIPFIPFVFFTLILLIFCLFFIYHNDDRVYQFSILLFCFLGSCYIFSMFLHSYILAFEMFFLYIIFTFIFYYLFTCKIKLVVFILRFVSYLGLLYIIVVHHQLINPFIGIFSSDKLFESKFERKLSGLNSSTIINLAKISQKDFALQNDYNVSFAELNSAKMIVLSNKYNITALEDDNLNKITQILGTNLYDEISYIISQDKILSEIIKSTSVIYSIILLLCIFSLQKTARKNSIIPS